MEQIPRVVSVAVVGNTQLLVHFENGVSKTYEIAPLLSMPRFQPLNAPALFKTVRVDTGGYGVSWNDEIDLSEFELWTNGTEILRKAL
jgi:hypothetical protein